MPLRDTMNKWARPASGKNVLNSASGDYRKRPVSSISRLNSSSSMKTSVFDKPIESASLSRPDSKTNQEVMDSRRYGYMRKLIKERQKREKQNKTKLNKI